MNISLFHTQARRTMISVIRAIFVIMLAVTLSMTTIISVVPYDVAAQGGATVSSSTPTTGGTMSGGNRTPARSSEGLIKNPLKVESIEEVVYLIVNIVLRIGAIVSVLFLIWAGFLFVKAQGDPKEIQAAKQVFYYTIVGIGLLFGAGVIVELIQGTIGSVLGR